MSPEYGATMGFFPPDKRTIEYLRQTNRDPKRIAFIEAYLREQALFIDHDSAVRYVLVRTNQTI